MTSSNDTVLMVDPRYCRRLFGGHIRDCVCRLRPHHRENGGGWAECPPEARGLLEPVRPQSLNAGAAEKPPEPEPPVAAVSIFAVGDSVRADGELLVKPAPAPPPAAPPRLNLTGEMCESCQSFNTRRIGTCLQCLDCYAEGGCG